MRTGASQRSNAAFLDLQAINGIFMFPQAGLLAYVPEGGDLLIYTHFLQLIEANHQLVVAETGIT